jgi:regulator of sirC expression with transglutaminase-like and TPR domain
VEASRQFTAHAKWLQHLGRPDESVLALECALKANPQSLEVRHSVLKAYLERKNWEGLERVARETLQMAPDDAYAAACLATLQDAH